MITFDICNDVHVMSDTGADRLKDLNVRVHNNIAECYAVFDGRKCMRNGACVIAKDSNTRKRINSKYRDI